MTSPPSRFVSSTQEYPPASDTLWFAFRQRQLLVREHDYALPSALSLEQITRIVPVRTQVLGLLDGTVCRSAELPARADAPPGTQFVDLRQLFGRLREELLALAGRAVQIVEWDRTHQFCGACGGRTELHAKARARVCPSCALEAYPRVAPAMIVLVERGEELLLARSHHFPPEIYAALAGFVEPGESAEEAVHREVLEETGVRVKNVRYFSSQPWPFPNSLMLAFLADYDSGSVRPDPDEIEDAQFFHVDRLPRTFPGNVSIGQWMLRDFLVRHGRDQRGDG